VNANANANANSQATSRNDELRGRMGEIEALIEDLERCPDPDAQRQARAIVQALLDFHGDALASLLGHVTAAGPPGRAILDTLARDEGVSSLLLLHGLHPDDLDVRVERALERVRPQLHGHGGNVALIGVDRDRGVVRLRLQGSCHGCPSSAATLTQLIETAIYDAAPEVAAIEVEGELETEPRERSIPPLVTIGPALDAAGRQRTASL
jgi:Fe-S cluster biogenesis protein NfuA